MLKILAVLLLGLSCSPCFARLGESFSQCEARYGKEMGSAPPIEVVALKEPFSDMNHIGVTYHFQHGVYSVDIQFREKIAGALSISRTDGVDLTEDEVNTLMFANSQGEHWTKATEDLKGIHPNTPSSLWTRDDGATARLDGRTIIFVSKSFIDAEQDYQKLQDQLSIDKTKESLKGM